MKTKNNLTKQLILDKHLIYCKLATKEDYVMLGREGIVYFFDTENAPIFPTEIVEKYNLNEVEYDTIDAFKVPIKKEVDEKGKTKECFLNQLIKEKKITTQIYIWQFGSSNSDNVYYGNTIEEFIEFIENINIERIEGSDKKVKISSFPIYVHNLAWDISFFLYYFKEKGFKQLRVSQDKEVRRNNKKEENSFDVTDVNNTVHNAVIQLEKKHTEKKKSKRKNSKVLVYDYITTLEFKDSMKITPTSLKNISKSFIEVDEIYIKNSEEYKYNLVRDPKNYIPSDIEKWYIYCDIYLLKEWYNQFIIPMYINEGIKNPCTISQISFDLILKESFKGINKVKYLREGESIEKLTDRKIYERHYELESIENNFMIKELIRHSYKGGHTTASRKFRELSSENKIIEGISIDITSSYPSQMCNKFLPYGKPRYYTGKPRTDLIDLKEENKPFNYHFVTIAFDGFTSKNPFNQFGLNVKVKKLTLEQKEYFNCSSNESLTTNLFIDSKGYCAFVGENHIEVLDSERKKLIEKYLKHNFVITVPYVELIEWLEDYNFYTYSEDSAIPKEEIIYIDTLSFKSEKGFFKKGIMHYYDIKEKADSEGNKPIKENAKVIINSFYGKHCSRRDREQKFYNFDSDIISFHSKTSEKYINEWESPLLFAVQYGSAVTSYGRIQLRKTVRILGNELFCYSDTDSIKMNYNKEKLIKTVTEYNSSVQNEEDKLYISGINSDKKVLGFWDFEYSFSDFKVVGQKKYMYKKEGTENFVVKCAGLPKDIRDQIKTKEEFSIGNSFIKKAKRKVPGGNLLMNIVYSLNDVLRN